MQLPGVGSLGQSDPSRVPRLPQGGERRPDGVGTEKVGGVQTTHYRARIDLGESRQNAVPPRSASSSGRRSSSSSNSTGNGTIAPLVDAWVGNAASSAASRSRSRCRTRRAVVGPVHDDETCTTSARASTSRRLTRTTSPTRQRLPASAADALSHNARMLQERVETVRPRSNDLIPPGGEVTCLVSGGADSTCLWHALGALGYGVSAVHVQPRPARRARRTRTRGTVAS